MAMYFFQKQILFSWQNFWHNGRNRTLCHIFTMNLPSILTWTNTCQIWHQFCVDFCIVTRNYFCIVMRNFASTLHLMITFCVMFYIVFCCMFTFLSCLSHFSKVFTSCLNHFFECRIVLVSSFSILHGSYIIFFSYYITFMSLYYFNYYIY